MLLIIQVLKNAFDNTSIEKILIPGDIEWISPDTFNNCSNLEAIVFTDSSNYNYTIYTDKTSGLNEDCKVYGYTNTIAPEYAKAINREFVPLDDFSQKEIEELTDVNLSTDMTTQDFTTSGTTSDSTEEGSVNNSNNYTGNGTIWIEVDGGEIEFDPSTGLIVGASKFIVTANIPSQINGIPVVGIAEEAFKNCEFLETIILPDSIKTIGARAFEYCISLKSITLPSGIEFIDVGTFRGCESLISIHIPDGVTEIKGYAFYECYNLKEIYIPSSLKIVGKYAFYDCNNTCGILQYIYYGGSSSNWKNITIEIENELLNSAKKIYNSYGIDLSTEEEEDEEEKEEEEIIYTITDVYNGVFYNEKLPGIENKTVTLHDGTLPAGVGLYSDGTLYGIPTKVGVFEFVVKDGDTYRTYRLTVSEPTSNIITENNTYIITTELPTITSNTSNYFFTIDRESEYFLELYINGNRLVQDVDYEISETDITKILIYYSTLSGLPKGSNVVTAIFDTSENSGDSSYGDENTGSASQLFEKETEQELVSVLPFTDVYLNAWYYDTLDYLYKKGIFNGTSEDKFSPNDDMTRAMLVVTLYRMENEPTANSTPFKDVKLTDWYGKAVSWAKSNNIVNGLNDTTFGPNDLLTREQMAHIINNYCNYKGIQVPANTSENVSDIDEVYDYAKTSVKTMYQGGVLNSDSQNNFNPTNTTSRADAAYILGNFLLKS